MDLTIKRLFLERWQTYFPGAALPITFYYPPEPPASSTLKTRLIGRDLPTPCE